MDISKLQEALTEVEGALDGLQKAMERKEQDGIDAAMLDLRNKLQSIRSLTASDSTIDTPQQTAAKKYIGWRVLHQAEGGYAKNPLRMPEVIPPLNFRALEMTEAIQRMSFELMQHFNPAITPQLWSKVHDHDRAFTNFNGFGKPGDKRENFITNENPGRPLPKYDKAQRLCGGQFVRGEVLGEKLVCIPGVHGIDATKPMPSLQIIVDNNWYLHAVTLNSPVSNVSHFPQGRGGPVVIPFIFSKEIEFELKWFVKWEEDTLPDPLKMYKI